MASGMRWNTPRGQQGMPGYEGMFQQPEQQPPPQFGPMQGAMPNGYADMFAGPIQQPLGLMDLMGQASQQPGVSGQGVPMGLMDALGMASGTPGPSGSANPFMSPPPVAPIPRPRPMKAETYTIRKGDTLTAIAKRNGTTVKALLAKNPQIKNADRIVAGAKIKV
jgi:hypothetical protein